MSEIVVVGAGHNGLTAACYLARAGHRVTVFEASDAVGGMTSSQPLFGAAPQHLASQCAIDAVYWKASSVATDLELARFGLRVLDHDPAWCWLGADGSSLLLSHGLEKTMAEIRRFSRADADRYAEFARAAMGALAVQDGYGAGSATRPSPKTLLSAARRLADRPTRRLLAACATRSAAEIIDDQFRSEQLRGAFAAMASILGSITQDSSGLGVLATAPLHRYGVARPVGGMQAIPDALRRCLEAAGGQVRCASPVTRLRVRDGRVDGVVVQGEAGPPETLHADCVVTAVAPQVVAELLSGADIPGTGVLAGAPSNADGVGCFKLDLAYRGRVVPRRHQALRPDGADLRRPTLFTGTLEQVVAAEQEARQGRFPPAPPLTITILSATDPTQAPDGDDTVYAYAPAPIYAAPGWPSARSGAQKSVRSGLDAVLDASEAAELDYLTETPEDLEQRLGAPRGCIYHVDQVITRLGPLRPGLGWAGHRTRVPGLVLTGAGTHPGGGVSGIPGQLAAKALLAGHHRDAKSAAAR